VVDGVGGGRKEKQSGDGEDSWSPHTLVSVAESVPAEYRRQRFLLEKAFLPLFELSRRRRG
jgi:hypothetical protein